MKKIQIFAALLLVAAFTLASCAGTQRTFKKDSPCGQIDMEKTTVADLLFLQEMEGLSSDQI